MTHRPAALIAIGLIVGAICSFIFVLFMFVLIRSTSAHEIPPTVAGQRVPAQRFQLDLEKRYDLFVDRSGGNTQVFRGVKILGFTGPDQDGSDGNPKSGSSGYSFFDRWLVAEQAGGRRVYIPPHGIYAIEESEGQ